MYRSVDAAKLPLEQIKLAREDEVLEIEDVSWDELPIHTQNHMRMSPDLGTAQFIV